MLTPSTPTAARLNSVSSAHSAEANVLLTPRLPAHAAEFSSSSRKRSLWLCAIGHVRGDLLGETGRGRVGEQIRDRREERAGRVVDAAAERIAMEGHDADRGLGGRGTGRGRPSRPAPANAGPASGTGGSSGAPARELVDVVGWAVRVRPREDDVPAAVAVPGKRPVQVGLVADLERLDVVRADPLHDRPAPRATAIAGRPLARLMPMISVSAERADECERRAKPASRQRVVDPAGRDHPPDRPPGRIGAVTADPEHRRAGRAQAP